MSARRRDPEGLWAPGDAAVISLPRSHRLPGFGVASPVSRRKPRLPWIFVDGSTQQTFRIRLGSPTWEPVRAEQEADDAHCQFHITTDDGSAFSFQLQIAGDVLNENRVQDAESLLALIQAKGVEIIEGAIHNGIRGDQSLVWDPDGVSVINKAG